MSSISAIFPTRISVQSIQHIGKKVAFGWFYSMHAEATITP